MSLGKKTPDAAPRRAETFTSQRGSAQLKQLSGAERLAGIGFRFWLSGYQTGAIESWERAWNLYAGELGPHAARTAIRDLSCWVRAVRGHARRDIEIRPAHCDRFCYDECLAVSLIGAAQNECPAVKACAFALLGSPQFDEVITSAGRFAAVLRDNSMLLQRDPLVEPLERGHASASHPVH